jgi:hypothetical protein
LLSFLFPVLIGFLVFTKHAQVKEEAFLKIYGSLFEEFRNDKGVASTVFYLIFSLRRLIYVFDLFLLYDYPEAQVAINVSFSLLVVLYIVYFKAFIGKRHLWFNFWLEVVCSLVFFLTGLWLKDMSQLFSDVLVIVVIVFVISTYPFALIMIILDLKDFFKELCKKEKVRIVLDESNLSMTESRIELN